MENVGWVMLLLMSLSGFIVAAVLSRRPRPPAPPRSEYRPGLPWPFGD